MSEAQALDLGSSLADGLEEPQMALLEAELDVEVGAWHAEQDGGCCGRCCGHCRPLAAAWRCAQACGQRGPVPHEAAAAARPLVYDSGEVSRVVGEGGGTVSPYTQDLVIVNRQLLSKELFRRLRFTNAENFNRLVTEVEYGRRSGEVYYDVEARDNLLEDGYARLITLNWWYQQLFLSLVLASVTIANLFSNIVFCCNLFFESHLSVAVPFATRCVFVVLFVVTEYCILRKCGIEAAKEWERKADPSRAGDLVVGAELNALDETWAWVAMFSFKVIHLDAIVKDIIIWLHPWKNVQAYGAFKADGHRCYLIGWASEYMYRCENKQGQEELLSHQLFLVGILSTFKINIVIESGSLSPLVLTVPSIINFFVILVKHWALLNDRTRHWDWLNEQHRELRDDSDIMKAIHKQKSVHFPGINWKDSLHERRRYVFRTVMAVLIPVLLGVGMHYYDQLQRPPGSAPPAPPNASSAAARGADLLLRVPGE